MESSTDTPAGGKAELCPSQDRPSNPYLRASSVALRRRLRFLPSVGEEFAIVRELRRRERARGGVR